jgi:hypothetical protein
MVVKETYTQWWIKHPWHVSNEPYPADKDGNCSCDCEYCKKRGEHKATLSVHLKAKIISEEADNG